MKRLGICCGQKEIRVKREELLLASDAWIPAIWYKLENLVIGSSERRGIIDTIIYLVIV